MIREKRQALNMTMLELANVTGCSESFISLIELGQRRPSVDLAKRLGAVLGIPWPELFDGDGTDSTGDSSLYAAEDGEAAPVEEVSA